MTDISFSGVIELGVFFKKNNNNNNNWLVTETRDNTYIWIQIRKVWNAHLEQSVHFKL